MVKRQAWTVRQRGRGKALRQPSDGATAPMTGRDSREQAMRTYLHIHLQNQTVQSETLTGEALVKAGRYLIAKTLVESQVATVDPLEAV